MAGNELNRRDLLKATGATGVGLAAGCSAPTGRRQEDPPADPDVERVAADPTEVPAPVDWSEPRRHEVSMATEEVTAEIQPGVTFDYMTFDGQIPGPMVRVREGDRIHMELTNPEDSNLPHNIDFHAAYGPGGGAEDTTITPGESAEIEFTAAYPGVHIYHCAVAGFDHHVSAGMFGAILVEPEGGLPEVDRELYFGQHEIYAGDQGQDGQLAFDFEAMNDEEPTYVVYNGEPYAFTADKYGPIEVETDEEIRVFFANGGPNLTSSWHAIGNVWSRLYRDGDLVSEPSRYVETTPVPPGSVSVAKIDTPVPGPIRLVDHAATRAVRKGALGVIEAQGEENPEIYDGGGEGGHDYGTDTQEFDGWFDDVSNYTGVVDKTDEEQPVVGVGTEGNGGQFGYEPAAIEVSTGTTVVWEWTGEGGYHDVAHVDGDFQSETVQERGHTFEYTFDSEGEYRYVCTPHESLGMKGIVVVS